MFRLRERELQKLLTPGKKAQRKKKEKQQNSTISATSFLIPTKTVQKKIKKKAENNNALLFLLCCPLWHCLLQLPRSCAGCTWKPPCLAIGASGQKSRWPTPTPATAPAPSTFILHLFSAASAAAAALLPSTALATRRISVIRGVLCAVQELFSSLHAKKKMRKLTAAFPTCRRQPCAYWKPALSWHIEHIEVNYWWAQSSYLHRQQLHFPVVFLKLYFMYLFVYIDHILISRLAAAEKQMPRSHFANLLKQCAISFMAVSFSFRFLAFFPIMRFH